MFIQETLTQSIRELPAVTLVNDGIQTENLHKTQIIMNELGLSWSIVQFVIIWNTIVQFWRIWTTYEPSYWQRVCKRSLWEFLKVTKCLSTEISKLTFEGGIYTTVCQITTSFIADCCSLSLRTINHHNMLIGHRLFSVCPFQCLIFSFLFLL